jgi:hypothetical protein
MQTIEQDDDESPTTRESPSGKWIIAVDRGQRLIESAIARLEAGDDVQAAIEDLRAAHALVGGGAS